MNTEPFPELALDNAALLEVGITLGQTHAFGLVAGRCSVAQAEAIRRLREEKLYRTCAEKWDDFCPRYLKMSRSEADRTIKLLEEFGPVYFELSQLTRISPEAFRAISPAIENGVLHCNGEAIPITPENSRQVAAAVAELRRAIPKAPTTPEWKSLMQEIQSGLRDMSLSDRIHKLLQCCLAIAAEFDKISSDEGLTMSRFVFHSALASAHAEFQRLALQNGVLEGHSEAPANPAEDPISSATS
jgi:hypothetical protein